MADRKKQLGLEAAILVLKGMAKFHALSKVLLDRGEIPLDVFGKHAWHRNEGLLEMMFQENVRRLTVVMEKWGDEWKEAKERLEKAAPELGRRVFKALAADPTEFTVLNHGDCWTNNLLFRYGDDPELPTTVKFIDWQLSFVTSPSKDIWYFFVTSVRQDVREQHFDRLLEAYCDSLISTFANLNYEGLNLHLRSLKDTMSKRILLPLTDSFVITPMMLSDETKVPDFEEVVKQETEATKKGENSPETWNPLSYMSSKNERIIKAMLQQAMDANVI